MGLFSWMVVGFLAAAIAGLVTGRSAGGCLTKIVVGVIGAFIGGALANYAGYNGKITHFGLRSVLIAALGSSVLLLLLGAIEGGSGRRRQVGGPRRPGGPGRRSLP